MTTAEHARQAEIEYVRGYLNAIRAYGIWRDGQQTIGCLDTPIKKVIAKLLNEYCLTEDALGNLVNAEVQEGASARFIDPDDGGP